MKSILRTLSIVLFIVAGLCFAATSMVPAELSNPLSYAAAGCGVVAVLCNFVIRPKEDKEDKKKKK